MRLIVDTNRIIAALIKDSLARRIITHINTDLLTISFSDKEVEKYRAYIIEKASIDSDEFDRIFETIRDRFIIINDTVIMTKINEAGKIMDNIDPDDTPFIAAALATNSDIWSDDNHFQKQKSIRIWTTKDLEKFV
ncbi:MAG: PIN domain-containing protein [Candidatus Aenigmatarchaeota archaeon]